MYEYHMGDIVITHEKLYESVDLMWYIAGDRSIDFNFYSKRMILSGIYGRVLLCYFNNDDKSNLFYHIHFQQYMNNSWKCCE